MGRYLDIIAALDNRQTADRDENDENDKSRAHALNGAETLTDGLDQKPPEVIEPVPPEGGDGADTQTSKWAVLRHAVREAKALGAEFRIVGADVEIDGDIPDELRERLPERLLWQYFGAAAADSEALEFSRKLGVEAVAVRDEAGARAAAKALERAPFLGIDIETATDERPPAIRINRDGGVAARQDEPGEGALDPHAARIATLQLYGGGDECFVFVGEALELMLGSNWLRQQHLVAHNAGFELKFLRHHAPQPASSAKAQHHPVECTMQAAGLLHGVTRRSLKNACKATLGLTPPKTLQKSCWGAKRLSPGQIAYAATDAVLAHKLWSRVGPMLRRESLFAAYELQRDAIPAVAAMELRGLGFDRDEHARQIETWTRDLASSRRQFAEIAGRPPPAKPAETRAWLAHVLGDDIATWPKTKKGGLLSTTHDDLVRLSLRDIPAVKPLLTISAAEKLLQSFGPRLAERIHPVTGRIHAAYKISGAKSGRFSSSDPNLQQLPSGKAPAFRGVIVPAPGNVLICGDYAQIELRAAAWRSKDRELTKVYEEGRDLHRETAAAIAGVPVETVTPEQRQAAKPPNFGAIYGIGPDSLAVDAFANYGVEMTVVEAKAALDRFFGRFQTLNRWRWDHWARVKAQRMVRIGCGRLVKAEWEPVVETESGPRRRISFPQACNLPIQGVCADCMLRAIVKLHKKLRTGWSLVATVHDELLLEVPEADAEAAAAALAEAMTEAFVETFPGAPTLGVVEVHIGGNWTEAKG
jgi:DNA polymerase-1